MKRLNYILTLTAIIAISFSSCKKDDSDDAPAQKSTSENLTAGGWIVTAITVDPPFFGVSDLYAQYDACEKDDIETYKSGGQILFDEGATKCDPDDPQTTTGAWVLSADEKVVTITEDGSSYSFNIEVISETTLKINFTEELDGIKYKFTATYRH